MNGGEDNIYLLYYRPIIKSCLQGYTTLASMHGRRMNGLQYVKTGRHKAYLIQITNMVCNTDHVYRVVQDTVSMHRRGNHIAITTDYKSNPKHIRYEHETYGLQYRPHIKGYPKQQLSRLDELHGLQYRPHIKGCPEHNSNHTVSATQVQSYKIHVVGMNCGECQGVSSTISSLGRDVLKVILVLNF